MPILERHLTQVVSDINKSNILTMHMMSAFKFCVIGGIFLHMFADSLLFDMMLNTAYEDGVDIPQDLLDRDMSLGVYITYHRVSQSAN